MDRNCNARDGANETPVHKSSISIVGKIDRMAGIFESDHDLLISERVDRINPAGTTRWNPAGDQGDDG